MTENILERLPAMDENLRLTITSSSSRTFVTRSTSFLYRLRTLIYLGIVLPVWYLNSLSGIPLIAFLTPTGSIFPKIFAFFSGLLCLLGIYLRMVGTAYIGRESVWKGIMASGYISRGPYRFVRHPIYLGSLVILISLVPMCSLAGGTLLLAGGGSFTVFLSLFEERALSDQHPNYRQEMMEVPRFFPRKGYFRFVFGEGLKKVVHKWRMTVRSESFNLAFAIGFLAFAASFRTLYFWISFLSAFIAIWFMLLCLTRTVQTADPHS